MPSENNDNNNQNNTQQRSSTSSEDVMAVKEVSTTGGIGGMGIGGNNHNHNNNNNNLNDSWRPMEDDDDDDSSFYMNNSNYYHDTETEDDDDGSSISDMNFFFGYTPRMFSSYGGGLLKNAIQEYWKFLNEKPVITKAITSSIISALGAILSARKYHHPTASASTNRNHYHHHNINTIHSTMTSAAAAMGGPHIVDNHPSSIDWLDVIAFAVHGGLVGGPIGHYWNQWLFENGPESQSMSMLFDQLIAQPPLLFILYMFLDMTRAAVHEIPHAWNRSLANIGSTVALSWRFWPIAVYCMLRFLKKRKHYTIAMNVCSLYWVSRLAEKRSSHRKELLLKHYQR